MNGNGRESPAFVTTSHEIGFVTTMKLIAIFWAGTVPIVVPAWLIIKAEIAAQNVTQDERMSLRLERYVTREELAALRQENDRRLSEIRDRLDAISRSQQKVMVKLKVDP